MTRPPAAWAVRARNIATDSENRIHDDEVARRYGFAGGLVPGIVVYGYLVRPVVEALGTGWLERGVASVRLVSPCYDGDEITVRALGTEASAEEAMAFELVAARSDGTVCARGRAAQPRERPAMPDLGDFPLVPLPRPRLTAAIDALPAETNLGSLVPSASPLVDFARDIGDDLGLCRGAHEFLHPGVIPGVANEILARSIALGPWIHAASEIVHLSAVQAGDRIGGRGRVVESFVRKGHEIAVLDVLVLAGEDRPVARVRKRRTAAARPSGETRNFT